MPIDPRLLPQDLECERVLLGVCLTDAEVMAVMRSVVSQEDFATERHRRIFAAMQELAEEERPVDRLTVTAKLTDKQQLDLVGGMSYICELDGTIGTILGIDEYAARLRKLSMARKASMLLAKAADEIHVYGADAAEEIITRTAQSLGDLSGGTGAVQGFATVGQIVAEAGGIGEFLSDGADTVPTPFGWVNELLGGGLRAEELAILAARPSVGKSAVAAQFAETAARAGKTVHFFSLEMPAKHIAMRMACSVAGIDSLIVRRPDCPAPVRERFRRAINEVGSWPIFYDRTGSRNPLSMDAALRAWRRETGGNPDLVIIDYLQLMSGVGKAESRNNEVGNITRALKVMAQEFKCPFLVLSQLARPENDNARPTLKALRDSGCIEQDGDVIWFLHQDLDQKPEVYRVTHFELAKQRNGPVGARSMMFDCVHTRLVEKTEVAPPPAQQQRNWNDD